MKPPFEIENGISQSIARVIKRGRKPGSKDSQKSSKRSLSRSPIVTKAADDIRNSLSGCIFETAKKHFHEHVTGREGTFSIERLKEDYSERLRDFENMIAVELRKNPQRFSTYWVLGNFHRARMKNAWHRKIHRSKAKDILISQLKSLNIIE